MHVSSHHSRSSCRICAVVALHHSVTRAQPTPASLITCVPAPGSARAPWRQASPWPLPAPPWPWPRRRWGAPWARCPHAWRPASSGCRPSDATTARRPPPPSPSAPPAGSRAHP
eukprot:4333140-Prymnesium_polylepis.1